LLARAVAGEAGVPFFSASGSEFDEMYVGVGARRIRELFTAARKNSPAIVFIDELDAIGGKRSPKDQTFHKQTLNQLLTEMDGFSTGEGIILIGATNFPESLDKALVRPGRFDKHVVVPLPDVRGRMEILRHHMQSVQYDHKAVDISVIARGTIGFSGADLQALVNQAAVKASADNADAVRPSHFEWAKERIMMGAARTSAFISPENKLATAYHEAGHAVSVASRLDSASLISR
jgi:ATP-dependent metalloprotease